MLAVAIVWMRAPSSVVPASSEAAATREFVVATQKITDEKAVFATVESANTVFARARIGGTIAALKVRQGDHVAQGQIIAVVGDRKLGLQIQAQGAQVQAAKSEMDKAQRDLARGQALAKDGFVTKARLDQLQAVYDVAVNTFKSLSAQQSVTEQQQNEGEVLAPTSGRILTVPVTAGTVVMPGEIVATMAEQNYILRLSVPERHAVFIRQGDAVRVDTADLQVSPSFSRSSSSSDDNGTITLVYPKVVDGRVEADATIEGLGDYFVGQRVRVWIPVGERETIVVPVDYLITRDGIDYARLEIKGGQTIDVPVQRGDAAPPDDMKDGIEILTGLKPGDVLVRP
ncbi:MAG: efflux RND transporter periplasmic adaptor subunit [Alphaproteobacteria bacterium]|nr:efflux RND transporter periplasmic adaptor subunit [Alphaproteobacteria bacterium]